MIRSRRAVGRGSPKSSSARCSGYSKDWEDGKVAGRMRDNCSGLQVRLWSDLVNRAVAVSATERGRTVEIASLIECKPRQDLRSIGGPVEAVENCQLAGGVELIHGPVEGIAAGEGGAIKIARAIPNQRTEGGESVGTAAL